MTLHAKSACDVYLSFGDGYYREWNSDELERINFVKKNEVVETMNYRKWIINHKHLLGDETVIIPETTVFQSYVTIFVK